MKFYFWPEISEEMNELSEIFFCFFFFSYAGESLVCRNRINSENITSFQLDLHSIWNSLLLSSSLSFVYICKTYHFTYVTFWFYSNDGISLKPIECALSYALCYLKFLSLNSKKTNNKSENQISRIEMILLIRNAEFNAIRLFNSPIGLLDNENWN